MNDLPMYQNAMRRKPADEWHSVQGSALQNPDWVDASSVNSRSASLRERLVLLSQDKDVFNKAKQLLYIRKEYQLKVKDIADIFQVKSSYICQLIRLNRLPEMIKDGYYGKQINVSLLFIISRLRSEQDMILIYEKILQSGFSVMQTESLVREILYKIKDKGNYLKNEEIEKLVQVIKNIVPDVMVKFRQTQIKSILRIEIKGNLETTSTIIRKIIS